MSGVLRLLIISLVFVLVSCGSSGNRRRTAPPECRKDADCTLATADGGGVAPPCTTLACVDFACKVLPVDDGTTCDDSDDKTVRDKCRSQVCKGEPATCTEQAGPCQTAVVDPKTNECTLKDVADGTSCDDKDLCTEVDSCKAGKCVGGSPVTCEAKDACHVAGTCDPKTGKCDEPNADDGTACDDALLCTENDVCTDGVCKGTDIACDDGLACSRDYCDEALGGCQVDVTACACETAATCDDGNGCNGVEICNTTTGYCEAGTALDCSSKNDACHRGTCDKATGACVATAVADGGDCDDGNLCTRTDTCQKGTCTGASPKPCAALDQCHDVGTCDPKTGACSDPPKANGTACDDKLACSTGDVCTGGSCGGAARVCNDGIACTVDGCSEASGGCTANTGACGCTKDADCSDGNACTGIETCDLKTLKCVAGTPVSCAAATDACNTGVCNPTDGKCTAQPKPNGTACNDANACTQFDACTSGKCGGTAVVCPAPDQCHTQGTCNTTTGVCSTPVKATGTACNDGLACTTGDACNAAGACTGPARVCNDGVTCTVDSCSEAAGGCVTDRSACQCTTDANCNDGNACNGVETCNQATGTCRAGTAVSCATLTDACNTGTCNTTTGACTAVPKANGTACNDGALCTTSDVCTAGKCGGTGVTCPAPDQCHNTRTCDPASGQCTNPAKANGTTCNDGKTCTTGDVCTAGVCGGGALGCADTIACTVDSCVEPTGCAHNTSACQCTKDSDCNDGNACNGTETCNLTNLTCVPGTAISCAALNDACNTGTCTPATGECTAVPKTNGTACNDGNACTTVDGCQSGRCVGASPVVCPAPDQCHNTRVCNPGTGVCSNPAKTPGTLCNDGLFCTSGDACSAAGVCTGAAVVCNDGIACTTDVCTEAAGRCVSTPTTCQCTKDADCSDGNACTGVETCNLGNFTCVAGTAVDCSRLTNVCNTGTCNTTTGACSAVPKTGAACNDSNACTATDTCSSTGVCTGAGAVACTQPANQCQQATCVAPGGCVTGNKPDTTACNDGSACTLSDQCRNGTCGGTTRDDKIADWGDDPGAEGGGPLSIDLMAMSDNRVAAVGVYTGKIDFAGQTLDFDAAFRQALYFATYAENGTNGNGTSVSRDPIALVAAGANGGFAGFTVSAAAMGPDDSFVIVGTVTGQAQFGLKGNVTPLPFTGLILPYIARFEKDGALRWVWYGQPDGTNTIDAVTILSDGATIAAGTNDGALTFLRGQASWQVPRGGAWAARLESDGSFKFVKLVAVNSKQTGVTVRGVTGHPTDRSFTLFGEFQGDVTLGEEQKIGYNVFGANDVWVLRLEPGGASRFGAHIGDTGTDRAGAIQSMGGDDVVVAAETAGGAPKLEAAVTRDLHTLSGGLQTNLVTLDKAGTPLSATLIGNGGRGASRSYALGFGKDKSITLTSAFSIGVNVYSKAGFGTGAPTGTPVVVASTGGIMVLASRFEPDLGLRWANSAGGSASAILSQTDWDLVMCVHPTTSVTIAGMFQSQSTFGIALPKTLVPGNKAGSPFVTHVDSQQALDNCP